MDIQNKTRVHWACRRGMRELDLMIMPFFEAQYDTLSSLEKQMFITLLAHEDPQLFSWFMCQSEPDEILLKELINKIRQYNEQKKFMAG